MNMQMGLSFCLNLSLPLPLLPSGSHLCRRFDQTSIRETRERAAEIRSFGKKILCIFNALHRRAYARPHGTNFIYWDELSFAGFFDFWARASYPDPPLRPSLGPYENLFCLCCTGEEVCPWYIRLKGCCVKIRWICRFHSPAHPPLRFWYVLEGVVRL